MRLHLRILFCVLLGGISFTSFAQRSNLETGANFFQVDERKVIETKWKYTYALHLESNTIIHKAENAYDYFLYFRYNYKYEQYLNGKYSKGTWSLAENELFYSFKHIQKFTISTINKKHLVLEFTQPNSKGTYQYHFVKVTSDDAPFIKPQNQLPDVNVEAINPVKKEKKWWVFNKSKKKNKVKKNKEREKDNLTYISIEVIGGGFYGGVNPTLRDYIQIKSDGRLIKEYKSVQNGLVVTKRNIPRKELEAFAEYILSQDFFKMERVYDCESELCQKRKQLKPTPIPLRLAVAYGDKRKVVTIGIFGKDAHNIRYIEYPEVLDKIIAEIQKMSFRMNPS